MQIQISWLLQKPTDLDLHCLQRSGYIRVKQDKGWGEETVVMAFAFLLKTGLLWKEKNFKNNLTVTANESVSMCTSLHLQISCVAIKAGLNHKRYISTYIVLQREWYIIFLIFRQDKIFRRKHLSTGANFVHVYIEIWDKGILKFNKFSV